MADNRAPGDVTALEQLLGEPVKFAQVQAEASHSRIDVEHRRRFPVPGGYRSPFCDLAGIIKHGEQTVLDKLGGATWREAI